MKFFEKIILNTNDCDWIKSNVLDFTQAGFRGGSNGEIGYDLKKRNSLKGDLYIYSDTIIYQKINNAFKSIGYELNINKIFFELYKYQPGHFIKKHIDIDIWENLRFGQLCIQMSEPNKYEGGELVYYDEFDNSHIVNKEIGNAILFSHEVAHEVKPIISGERLSLIFTILKSDVKAIYKKGLI